MKSGPLAQTTKRSFKAIKPLLRLSRLRPVCQSRGRPGRGVWAGLNRSRTGRGELLELADPPPARDRRPLPVGKPREPAVVASGEGTPIGASSRKTARETDGRSQTRSAGRAQTMRGAALAANWRPPSPRGSGREGRGGTRPRDPERRRPRSLGPDRRPGRCAPRVRPAGRGENGRDAEVLIQNRPTHSRRSPKRARSSSSSPCMGCSPRTWPRRSRPASARRSGSPR